MEPAFVVDLLDEAGKVINDVVEGFEGHRVDRLDLQRLHEALRLGVVVKIASAAHRARQAVCFHRFAEICAAYWAAPIGMMNAAGRRLAPFNGRLQGCHRQPRIDRSANGVADDHARPGVENDCDLDEAGRQRDIGYVGDQSWFGPVGTMSLVDWGRSGPS